VRGSRSSNPRGFAPERSSALPIADDRSPSLLASCERLGALAWLRSQGGHPGFAGGYQIYLDVIEMAWGDDPVANLNANLRDQPFEDPRRALPKPLLKTRARLSPHGEARQ
jgi:hypothetical protein